MASAHRLHAQSIQNPQKILSYKKKEKRSIFQPIIFFPRVVFSGAGVWSQEHINRPSRGHVPVESSAILRASPDNTIQPDQSNCLSLNSQQDISSACLFYLFNKQNKLNLLVSLIFLATTRLYITLLIQKNQCYSANRVQPYQQQCCSPAH